MSEAITPTEYKHRASARKARRAKTDRENGRYLVGNFLRLVADGVDVWNKTSTYRIGRFYEHEARAIVFALIETGWKVRTGDESLYDYRCDVFVDQP